MSLSILSSERITAILSTLAAVVILAAGVTAHQSHSIPQNELVLLESDLRFQLEQAFRHNEGERDQRIALLERAMQAWAESPQNQEDQKLLGTWLLESTIRSMPGTTEPLPSLPEFGKPAAPLVEEHLEASNPPEPASEETAETNNTEADNTEAIEVSHEELLSNNLAASTQEAAAASIQEVDKPLATQTVVEHDPPVEVKINLTELVARITGYHEGLDQIEMALLLANSPDLEFLEKQVNRLERLTRDFRFVALYHQSLSEKERQAIDPPRSMDATLAELGRLLRQTLGEQDGDFLESFDSAQQERVEQLQKLLADIVDRTT